MLIECKSFESAVLQVAEAGGEAIEFWRWADKDLELVKSLTEKYGIKVFGFCVDSADDEKFLQLFRKGLNSGNVELLMEALRDSTEKAKYLCAKALYITIGDSIDGLSYEEQMANVEKSLKYVKEYVEAENILLLVEPINPTERKTYVESRALPTFEVLRRVNSKNIKLLYDVYHHGMTGDLSVAEMEANIDLIGHIHIADAPGRAEIGTGNIDYNAIFDMLNRVEYKGTIGLECFIKGNLYEAINRVKNA